MSDIYRSQFRMPIMLFEKLKAEASRSGRSVNAELVGRLERSLTDSSNDIDMRILFETLERLSLRNPEMRYSFGVNFGGQLDERPAEIVGGNWTLGTEPGGAMSELLGLQANAPRSTKTKA
jgi:hypothetical protein